MVTAEAASAAISLLVFLGGVAGFLYRRDDNQQDDIDTNEEAINELDTAFARQTTRLFGHPDDRSDDGVIVERGERVEEAERELDSLQTTVQDVQQQAEQNGDQIDAVADEVEHLEEAVTEHASDTRQALAEIQAHLNDGVDVLPDGGDGESAEGEANGS